MDTWNDGKCMSAINSTPNKINITRRCNLKTKTDDFCFQHKVKKNYHQPLLKKIKSHTVNYYKVDYEKLNKEINSFLENQTMNDALEQLKQSIDEKRQYLNKNFKYTLLDIYDSWDEIKLEDQIKLDGEYWDINIIIAHITEQLNQSSMENPYPIYPNNPFNRNPFTPLALLILKKRLHILRKKINIALKLLLLQNESVLEKCYNESVEHSDKFSRTLMNLLQKNNRFKLINYKNSQSLYTGVWVNKMTPLSQFELLYDHWRNMPYQIMIEGYVAENYHKIYLKSLIDSYSQERYDLMNNEDCQEI
jgi:hypothetical protein